MSSLLSPEQLCPQDHGSVRNVAIASEQPSRDDNANLSSLSRGLREVTLSPNDDKDAKDPSAGSKMPEPKEPLELLGDVNEADVDGTNKGVLGDAECGLTLDLDEDNLDEEVLEYARRELGESDEVKCQTVHELREMIYERGECMPHRMDDEFLVRFLRAREYNVNRAHRLIVRYYNFKEEHPEIHQDVNPVEMRHIGDDDILSVPTYRTQCGRRMMIHRLGKWDPRKYPIEEIFKATVIILELGVLEPRAQILGGIVLFDLEGLAMSHVWSITTQVANMVMALMVTSFPLKTHAIHIINQSWVFDALFALFKPLLDSRMLARIFFHGADLESLHRHIKPECLPKRYGGTQDELPYYRWIDALSKVPRVVKEMKGVGYVIPDEILDSVKDKL